MNTLTMPVACELKFGPVAIWLLGLTVTLWDSLYLEQG